VWDDGHKWCFGCGYYIPASQWSQLLSESNANVSPRSSSRGVVSLPDDYTTQLPRLAVDWLSQYRLTKQEIARNGIGWSVDGVVTGRGALGPLLILPVWDAGVAGTGVLLWQGRNFGREGIKYYTRGLRDDILPIYRSLGRNADTIVVVEDIISAIKLSRCVDSMPLLGSFLNKEKALRLSKLYSHLTFWLDYDKAKEAVKQADALRPFFQTVEVVITERDPKQYSTEEMKQWLKLPASSVQ